MAIDLDPAASAHVDFGDIAAIAGLTKFSVAFTILVNAVAENLLFHQWGSSAATRSWLTQITNTNELGVGIAPTGPLYSRRTSALNIGAGNLLRVGITWDAALADADAVKFWVNGVIEANEQWFAGSNPASLNDAAFDVSVGDKSDGSSNPVDGHYSEVAIWDHVVPDWFCRAYGKGLSPRFYRKGGILYDKLVNTDYLRDEWGGVLAVNTGGTNAPHPPMYYPAPAPLLMGFPPPPTHISPPHIDDAAVSIRETQDASVSIGEAVDDSVSIRETEDATV